MICWGTTRQKKQRFKCKKCSRTSIKKRPDRKVKNLEILFERWLLNTETLERLAKQRQTNSSSLARSFNVFWRIENPPLPYQKNSRVLIVDGLIIERGRCVLIAIDGEGVPIAWLSCQRENFANWIMLFRMVKEQGFESPSVIVSDAQKGLQGAIKSTFPLVPHQRCMTHVVRLAQAWVTMRPRTIAGQELKEIIGGLYAIKTKEEAKSFIEKFFRWNEKHENFLKEKSVDSLTGRRWFTHRRLRAVRSLVFGALPNLFTFLEVPDTPRTTNKLEGGINSPLKALLRHHRGMSVNHKQTLVFRFLRARQKKKYQH